MKYLSLPVDLLRFWFVDSLFFFFRTWKNLIAYLEEDLAVGLMWRLVLTPLFHDTTVVGRALSFIFRLSRILIGLFAFFLATLSIFCLLSLWLILPLGAAGVVPSPADMLAKVILLSAAGLFLIHHFSTPLKKIWQVKDGNFWLASLVKKKDLTWSKILQERQVKILLNLLQLPQESFVQFQISDAELVLKEAARLAKESNSTYIDIPHFFVATIATTPQIENFLMRLNLKMEDFVEALKFQQKKKIHWRRVWIWDEDFAIKHLKGVNRGWLGAPTPTLDEVSLDLTVLSAKEIFPPFLGREFVATQVINILSQDQNDNVILVGLAGSGKSALIESLAKRIVAGDAPPSLATKRLVVLDSTKLLSGMRTQGDLADRVKNIFDEVTFSRNVILVIEEIHNLGMGQSGEAMNLYSLMLPFIESSSFQFIATTEPENYSKIVEKNSSFARVFTKVEVPPATEAESLEILQESAIFLERHKKITVTLLAIKKAVELSSKYIHDRVLPDSALRILQEAQALSHSGVITTKEVEEVFSHRVNVPVVELDSQSSKKLLNLENEIHQHLIDQEEAVQKVADTLRRFSAGLREQARPIGSFLFVGPTGVGKTELAKTLSDVYFKTQGAFLRFDMSEYQNPESVVRLIGSSGEGGVLTEAVRGRPYALLLLDEFEKSDAKILTLFLQVLEDGRLTDGAGRTVDFTNTIIIATSNAASLTIAKGLESGKSLDELDKQVNDELLQIFKPELINRFDEVILFKTLSRDDLLKIVRLKLNTLQSQLKEKGFLVEFDEELIRQLAERGFDPVLGARPLRRLIQDTLEAKLSRLILENKLVKGQVFQAGVELLAG